MLAPPQENSCFAHYHMTIDEYGLWTHAREVSHDSGVFYFDGRKIAARFFGNRQRPPVPDWQAASKKRMVRRDSSP